MICIKESVSMNRDLKCTGGICGRALICYWEKISVLDSRENVDQQSTSVLKKRFDWSDKI